MIQYTAQSAQLEDEIDALLQAKDDMRQDNKLLKHALEGKQNEWILVEGNCPSMMNKSRKQGLWKLLKVEGVQIFRFCNTDM